MTVLFNNPKLPTLLTTQGPLKLPTPAPAPAPLTGIIKSLPALFATTDTHSTYKAQLRGQSDGALAAEAKRLTAVIADASSGPDKNPGAAERARAQLGEVREEQQTRASFAGSKNPDYSRETHRMNDGQLSTERSRQLERYQEATTGFDRDPAKAADAKAKLDILSKEQGARFQDRLQGPLPKETKVKPLSFLNEVGYFIRATAMPDAQLTAERKKVSAELYDATHGAYQNPVAAENARKKLSMLDYVAQSRAPQSKPITDTEVVKYMGEARQLTNAQLSDERTRLSQAIRDWQKDPVGAANARRLLGVVDAVQFERSEALVSK